MAKPAKRNREPFVASLDQVRIVRDPDGETAVLEYAEDDVWTVHLRIGAELRGMTDQEILDLHNETIRARQAMRAEYDHVAVEVPMGRPQIEYDERCLQWVPRGGVLRVLVTDDQETSDPAFVIDDLELSLHEFGRLLHVWNGWGLRIALRTDDESPCALRRNPCAFFSDNPGLT